MNTLLWTVAIAGFLNLFFILIAAFSGTLLKTVPTPFSRCLDAIYSTAIALWAVYLLAVSA